MGKKTREVVYRIDAQFVNVNGHELVVMEDEEYERLLDIVDAAYAQMVLNDPDTRFLKWDEIKHEFMRTASRKRGKSPAARKKGSRRGSASKSRQHTVGKSRARS